jgi:hypothetical protein
MLAHPGKASTHCVLNGLYRDGVALRALQRELLSVLHRPGFARHSSDGT